LPRLPLSHTHTLAQPSHPTQPTVSSALRRLIVMVGVSATKRSVVAASPCGAREEGHTVTCIRACLHSMGWARRMWDACCHLRPALHPLMQQARGPCSAMRRAHVPLSAPHRVADQRKGAWERAGVRCGGARVRAHKVKPQSVHDQYHRLIICSSARAAAHAAGARGAAAGSRAAAWRRDRGCGAGGGGSRGAICRAADVGQLHTREQEAPREDQRREYVQQGETGERRGGPAPAGWRHAAFDRPRAPGRPAKGAGGQHAQVERGLVSRAHLAASRNGTAAEIERK
jgi:hypothetical protein